MCDKDEMDESRTGIRRYKTFLIFLILIIIISFILYTANTNKMTSRENSTTLRYQELYFEEWNYGEFDVNATLISSTGISGENPHIKLYVYDENGTLVSKGETTASSIDENESFNVCFKIEPPEGQSYTESQADKIKYGTFEVYESPDSAEPVIKADILLLNK